MDRAAFPETSRFGSGRHETGSTGSRTALTAGASILKFTLLTRVARKPNTLIEAVHILPPPNLPPTHILPSSTVWVEPLASINRPL